MALLSLVCPISPDDLFSYEAGQTLYTEQLSFVLLRNISEAVSAGVQASFVDSDDAAAVESSFVSMSSDWSSWLDGLFSSGTMGAVPAIPEPTDIDVYRGGGWWSILSQIGFRILAHYVGRKIEKWIDGGSGDTQALVDELKALRELFSTVNGSENVLSDDMQELIGLLADFSLSLETDQGVVSVSQGTLEA